MTSSVNIHWFRQDLRLVDNPSLIAAAQAGDVLPLFILDDENAGDHKAGAAGRWWLHHALTALDRSLDGKLCVMRGNPVDIIPKLVAKIGASGVFWNRCYEPWRIARDKILKTDLTNSNIQVESFNGSLLWEPWTVLKGDGTPYRVFTPFYRRGCLNAQPPRLPLPRPEVMNVVDAPIESMSINALGLLPDRDWGTKMESHWQIGEAAATARLHDFVDEGLEGYKEGRNFPARPNTSRLSAHLHWGEISPNMAWYAAIEKRDKAGFDSDIDVFLSELGWREFAHSLLYHFPHLPRQNLQSKFDNFPWQSDDNALRAWQQGKTGYPIIDAGMRELWETGYMHNRVRMIVGSFLVKNLLLHWHHGEAWFWDCLVDADLANNSAGWQWIAGCGADAAPYFRVFNPITQGTKFDADGSYTRRFVPELAALPNKYLFSPWEASALELQAAGIMLGREYPHPIVDVKKSREAALAAFATTRVES
ncbi:DNA photolyase family protein [Alphaproteobacteria bacterium]|nr:DNA photolyase family protein [Alphaproteobacteria bacterium]